MWKPDWEGSREKGRSLFPSICTGEQRNGVVNGRRGRIKKPLLKMGELR